MSSSYKSELNFSHIFETICFLKKPQRIIEIGILNGFSLEAMAKSVNSDCQIDAYDIFEEFNGNHSIYDIIQQKFKQYSNININYGDYYKKVAEILDNSIDIIHIDVANNGDVYEFAFENYMKKLKKDGIMILEGGSKNRDNVSWMLKYNKPKIVPIIEKYKKFYNITVIDVFPSMTIVYKK